MSISKTIAFSAAASMLALGATSAMAAGPVVVTPAEPVYTPAPAPVRDWSGAYGGLSFSGVSGGMNENTGGPLLDLDSDTGLGLFAGYNWQSGNLVYGGELNYTNFSTPFTGAAGSSVDDSLELRARVGYAMDNVLLYGFVGAARSDATFGAADYNLTGVSYGLGAQYQFTNGVFAGLELGRRDVSDTVGGNTLGADIDTVSLRVGFQF